MGRSQGRNKMASALLGGAGLRFKDSQKDLRAERLKEIDFNDNVYRDSPVPGVIGENQIGVSILWEGERGGLVFAMHPENDDPFATYEDIDDQEIREYLIEQIEQQETPLFWANSWNLVEDFDIRFPGQESHSMPKTKDYAVFASAVLDFNEEQFKELALSYFADGSSQIDSILKSNLSFQEKLNQLEQHLSKPDILLLIRDSATPIYGRPLKVAFRKNN
jgi:hypothetical protein